MFKKYNTHIIYTYIYIYNSVHTYSSRFIDEFSFYLDDVLKIYRKAYICGDININLLKINENNNYNNSMRV